jgi:hypothetical protein
MSKRQIIPGLALALAATLSACGSSSSDTASVSSIAKCAHARPQTISASTPVARMIAQKVVPGGWLFQSAGGETEAEEQAHAPGFDVYVFKNDTTAKEAFELFANAQSSGEFGGGGTYVAKNVVIDTDQSPPSDLDSFANALLKRCTGSSAAQPLHREEQSSEGSTEGATSEAPAAQTGTRVARAIGRWLTSRTSDTFGRATKSAARRRNRIKAYVMSVGKPSRPDSLVIFR